jgi:hypothetical protein
MSTHSGNFLSHMLETLHHLLLNISAKIRHQHIENSKMGDPKGDVDIWGKIGHFLEATPELSEADILHLQDEHIHQSHKNEIMHRPTLEEGAELSELAKYYQHKVRVETHPHMSDQMQRNTVDHINLALHLARKGDQSGARLHIELAESAMHTAGRFMTHDEYREFELRIEHRLQHIMEQGHQPHVS